MANPVIPSSQQPIANTNSLTPTQPWYLYLQNINSRITNTSSPTVSLQDTGLVSGAMLAGPVIVQEGGNDNIDTAANIVSATPFATAGSISFCLFINNGSGIWYISQVNTTAFVGNLDAQNRFQIPSLSQRMFAVQINSITNPQVTIYG